MGWDGFSVDRNAEQKEYTMSETDNILSQKQLSLW